MNVIEQTFDEAIPVDDITEHPDNPRRGDDPAVEESMVRNGFFGAILVQRSTDHVIAGNTRYRVMLRQRLRTRSPASGSTATTRPRPASCWPTTARQRPRLLRRRAAVRPPAPLVESEGLDGTGYDRAAYELLLQSVEADRIVGGIRQGVYPEERIDAYNDLDIRSLILPYESPATSRSPPAWQRCATMLGYGDQRRRRRALVEEALAAGEQREPACRCSARRPTWPG